VNVPWQGVSSRDDMLQLHYDYEVPCSCGCGQPLSMPEMHHGIIPKTVARGVKQRKQLDNPINWFMVNHECHQNIPSPEYFWHLSCQRFGENHVREWYEGMQEVFKSRLECLSND